MYTSVLFIASNESVQFLSYKETKNYKTRVRRKVDPERFARVELRRNNKNRKKRNYASRVSTHRRKLRNLGLPVPKKIVLPPTKMSSYESIVYNELKNRYPQYSFEKTRRLSFLINPKTGYPLELDLFCELLGLAIEVQGEQHYRPVSRFDKTENSFRERLYRDQIKRELCRKNGITLLEFKYNDNLEVLFDLVDLHIELYNDLLE